jgi:sec-independent protein translocase protein TatC
MTFWDHLDVLRTYIIRILVVWVLLSIAAFFFKDEIFYVVMAPKDDGFITYQWLDQLSRKLGGDGLDDFHVQLINTGLTRQFMLHVKASFFVGLLAAIPFAIWQILLFVLPALYANERRLLYQGVFSGSLMFLAGLLFSYFIVFPLTFRFLGTYQVSAELQNLISVESYIGTLLSLSLSIGLVFEIPVICWLLARGGILTAPMMSRYRKHSIVLILVLAAIITPTQDVFTLLIVSLPMWLLFEVSILIVRTARR